MTGALAEPVIVALPREVDGTNSVAICAELCSVLDGDVAVVVVDMTTTVICDSSGFRMLLVARDRAAESGVQLRLAVSADGPVLRALGLMGFDRVLRIFPSLQEAVTEQRPPMTGQAAAGEQAAEAS